MRLRFFGLILLLSGVSASLNGFGYVFDFYGSAENLEHCELVRLRRNAHLDAHIMRSYVAQLENWPSQSMLTEIRSNAQRLNLDDVGTLIYIKKYLGSAVKDPVMEHLYEWKLMRELGYDVLLTYTDSDIDVFARLTLEPAASTFIYEAGKRYHNTNFQHAVVKRKRLIHRDAAAHGRDPLLHESRRMPTLSARQKVKLRRFEYGGKWHELHAVTNLSLIEYLNDLPQFALGTNYLDRKLSPQAEKSFLDPLKTLLKPYSPAQQAAFLLKLVQQAFAYRSDAENHGFEKYNYPEETLTADYVDCEDKSLLYAYLLRELLDIPSVLLLSDSRKHVCVGAMIPGYSYGYSFRYKGGSYVVCEPTGLNYPPGKSAIALSEVSEVIAIH